MELVSTLVTPDVVIRRDTPAGRTRVIGAIMSLMALFIFWVFALGATSKASSIITFNPLNTSGGAPWHLASLTLPSRVSALVLAIIALAAGIETIVRVPASRVMARFGFVSILFLLGLFVWTVRSSGPSPTNFIDITDVLVNASGITMVLIFGSMSGIMCERAGVVNIAIEGQFLGGAFIGAIVASSTNSFVLATFAGAAVGALLGWVLAFFAVRYRSDQVIVGVVLVTMIASLTNFLNLTFLTPFQQYNTGVTPSSIPIPLLDKIPIIGPLLFNQDMFFYMMYVLVAGMSFALFKTKWGLRVRAVGEHPQAAATVGIRVKGVRYFNVILGGAIGGIGGVAFIALHGQFNPGFTSGLGYIALAAVIFGRWRPSGAVVASIIFGLTSMLASGLQSFNVPVSSEILGMFPYIITIAVVSGLIGRVRAPAADGIPYKQD
jgi:simple sugar transport system permease protein